ncbi:MAG TPA: hypothetical protein VJ997_14610, partial [Longimicrobiales bacterium]|nr:hypothetical protein [Longimicrobiales bacterium]
VDSLAGIAEKRLEARRQRDVASGAAAALKDEEVARTLDSLGVGPGGKLTEALASRFFDALGLPNAAAANKFNEVHGIHIASQVGADLLEEVSALDLVTNPEAVQERISAARERAYADPIVRSSPVAEANVRLELDRYERKALENASAIRSEQQIRRRDAIHQEFVVRGDGQNPGLSGFLQEPPAGVEPGSSFGKALYRNVGKGVAAILTQHVRPTGNDPQLVFANALGAYVDALHQDGKDEEAKLVVDRALANVRFDSGDDPGAGGGALAGDLVAGPAGQVLTRVRQSAEEGSDEAGQRRDAAIRRLTYILQVEASGATRDALDSGITDIEGFVATRVEGALGRNQELAVRAGQLLPSIRTNAIAFGRTAALQSVQEESDLNRAAFSRALASGDPGLAASFVPHMTPADQDFARGALEGRTVRLQASQSSVAAKDLSDIQRDARAALQAGSVDPQLGASLVDLLDRADGAVAQFISAGPIAPDAAPDAFERSTREVRQELRSALAGVRTAEARAAEETRSVTDGLVRGDPVAAREALAGATAIPDSQRRALAASIASLSNAGAAARQRLFKSAALEAHTQVARLFPGDDEQTARAESATLSAIRSGLDEATAGMTPDQIENELPLLTSRIVTDVLTDRFGKVGEPPKDFPDILKEARDRVSTALSDLSSQSAVDTALAVVGEAAVATPGPRPSPEAEDTIAAILGASQVSEFGDGAFFRLIGARRVPHEVIEGARIATLPENQRDPAVRALAGVGGFSLADLAKGSGRLTAGRQLYSMDRLQTLAIGALGREAVRSATDRARVGLKEEVLTTPDGIEFRVGHTGVRGVSYTLDLPDEIAAFALSEADFDSGRSPQQLYDALGPKLQTALRARIGAEDDAEAVRMISRARALTAALIDRR